MFNDTAVILEWQYPTSPNGIIEGFVICYKYELTQEGDYYNEVSIIMTLNYYYKGFIYALIIISTQK